MKSSLAVTIAATLLLFGCAKEEKPILPHTYISLVIALNSPEYISLKNPSTAVKINYYNSLPVGYLGNGVIVYNGLDGYYAYDATCPNQDYKSLNVTDQIFAECPVCKTRYNLQNGYAQGKGNLHLQRYNAVPHGDYLNIYN